MRASSIRFFVRCVVVLVLSVGLALVAVAPGARAATPAKAVQGEILRIEGEFYVLREASGREVRLHVNDKTDRLDHAVLEIGDPVRVYVTPDGHATSITHLGPADRIEEDDIRKPGRAPTK